MAGWVAAVAVAAAWETYALATGRETLSTAARRALSHPIFGPMLVGTAAAGIWHFAQMVIEQQGPRP